MDKMLFALKEGDLFRFPNKQTRYRVSFVHEENGKVLTLLYKNLKGSRSYAHHFNTEVIIIRDPKTIVPILNTKP